MAAESQTPPELPRPVVPVIDYPTQSAGNPDANRALLCGLLVIVPFITGLLAIRYGRRGLATVAAEPRAGGAGKARAGLVLGVVSIVVWSIAVVSLPPAFVRARQQAVRVHCMANLRQIGMGALMYAAANRGVLPASLDDVVGPTMIPAQVLTCPAAAGDPSKPPASTGKYGNYGYVYLGAGRRVNIRNAATTPLAYEPPTNHSDGFFNVLYFDGHAEVLQGAAAQAVLAMKPGAAATMPATPTMTPSSQSILPPPPSLSESSVTPDSSPEQ